jgi:hypothetical protein
MLERKEEGEKEKAKKRERKIEDRRSNKKEFTTAPYLLYVFDINGIEWRSKVQNDLF